MSSGFRDTALSNSYSPTLATLVLCLVCRIYFHPRGGRPGIISPEGIDIDASEFPKEWFEGLPDDIYKARVYKVERNKYKVSYFWLLLCCCLVEFDFSVWCCLASVEVCW